MSAIQLSSSRDSAGRKLPTKDKGEAMSRPPKMLAVHWTVIPDRHDFSLPDRPARATASKAGISSGFVASCVRRPSRITMNQRRLGNGSANRGAAPGPTAAVNAWFMPRNRSTMAASPPRAPVQPTSRARRRNDHRFAGLPITNPPGAATRVPRVGILEERGRGSKARVRGRPGHARGPDGVPFIHSGPRAYSTRRVRPGGSGAQPAEIVAVRRSCVPGIFLAERPPPAGGDFRAPGEERCALDAGRIG